MTPVGLLQGFHRSGEMSSSTPTDLFSEDSQVQVQKNIGGVVDLLGLNQSINILFYSVLRQV